MLAIQSTSRVSAVIAAAGACLLLGACGGGSNGTSASGSSSSSPASSGSSSSSAPAPAHSVAPAKGLLTGDFCKDFIGLGDAVTPSKAEEKKIDTDRSAAADFMDKIAADFDGLGKEGPPKIQKAMHTIASQYTALGDAARSGKSLTDLKKQADQLQSGGATGAAFEKVTTYMESSCI
jgi:hypothetical protein